MALNAGYPDASPERRGVVARLLKTCAAVGCAPTSQQMLLRTLQAEPLELYGMQHDDEAGDYLHSLVETMQDEHLAGDEFRAVLKTLRLQCDGMLRHRDQLGRTPLHHAAIKGLEGVAREILDVMNDDGVVTWEDALLKTPLDYAVDNGHAAVVEIFLSAYDWPEEEKKTSSLLATAIRSESVQVASLLMEAAFGLDFHSRRGENVLHIAAEHGLSALVGDLFSLGVQIDYLERVKGWTPLAVACVQGHDDTVKALLKAGADSTIHDHQKWLPKDHAAYRGYKVIVDAITTPGSTDLTLNKTFRTNSIMPTHRSPIDSVIFVHLGTLDLFRPRPDIDITPYRRRVAPVLIPDTDLTLTVSLLDSKQEYTTHWPFMSDNSDNPWVFTTEEPENAVLSFKLVNSLESKTIGTAIAMLSSLKGAMGALRESLIRDFKVPLFHQRHGHTGSVSFSFVVAEPYRGDGKPPGWEQKLEMEKSTIVGGHRGEKC